jgi:hypothetical protein
MVIVKVLILLEMAGEEMSEMKRSRELKNKGKANKLIKKGERSSGRIRVHELVDQCFEQTLYQIFGQFLEVVLRLESIVSHRYLPADSEMLMKEALSMVESGLRQYEEVLEWIRGDIITLKKMFPLKLEHKMDAKTTETITSVACRIDELWWGALDNSSEEKDEDDVSTNTEGEVQRRLTNATKKMIDFQTNISGFETKMQALMRECKERLIKRAGNSEKNSWTGWMKASHTSNDEESSFGSRSVISLKTRVLIAGLELSNLVIDFVFMMSTRDELAEKIGEFKAAFKWATKLNSMVIDKVVNLLEMVDREVRKITRSEELKNKGKSVIDDSDGDERSNERIRVQEVLDQFFKQFLYQIFVQFLEAFLRLEFITSHPKLSGSGLRVKKALSMIECDVKHCETVVKSLREDIMALQTMFPFKSEFEDAKMVDARNFVEPKIYELWIGLVDVHRTRYAREMEIQPSLNEGVELQEPREEELVEVEKEAKKPSNMDQLSAF